MATNLKFCWSCKKISMVETFTLGAGWYCCKRCGATDIFFKKSSGKRTVVNPKRSGVTQFQMPDKYFKKGGKK